MKRTQARPGATRAAAPGDPRGQRILVVDDDERFCFGLKRSLRHLGFEVQQAASCEDARRAYRDLSPDLAIIDYRLPDGNALGLMNGLQAMDASVPMVILTGHGTIDLAVRAIRAGADDFLTKPVELSQLGRLLRGLLRRSPRPAAEGPAPEAEPAPPALDPFAGRSPAIQELAHRAERVMGSDRPVLLLGETGSGKGTLASWIHRRGPWRRRPLVQVNCAGLKGEFLESDLFGHVKGAFTGATSSRRGLLERADQGILFLDEIGEMDPAVQAKILTVIEDMQFRRLGGVRTRRVRVKLLLATHCDLRRRVAQGRFREDLYYRISVLPLRLPPLCSRPEDIEALSRAILRALPGERRRPRTLTPRALAALQRQRWGGNIRELQSVLERAVVLSDAPILGRDTLQLDPPDPAPGGGTPAEVRGEPEDLSLRGVERRHISHVLGLTGGNVAQAAHQLRVPRSTLYARLGRLGIR